MNTDSVFGIDAKYHACPIQAFQGNPLIEALPPILNDRDLIKALSFTPKVIEEEKFLPPEVRLTALGGFDSFTYPLPEYQDFARRVESALYRGYSSKNPCLPTSNHFLYYMNPDETPVAPITGRFDPKPTGIVLVGPSGCGKNWMFERVLQLYPQVIIHKKYKNKSLPIKQIVWLKITCPGDGDLSTFAAKFLLAIDELLGTDHYKETMRGKYVSKGILETTVTKLSKNYRVGLLAIDEFSNMRLPKNATPDNVPPLLKLILNLMNGAGVPIVYGGNPEMIDVMQLTLKTARRAENGGVVQMGPLHPAVWTALSKRLWTLQLTNESSPWSQDLAQVLYDASRGLVEIAVRGFFEAQRLVIGSGDERLTDAAIIAGATEAIRLSEKTLALCQNANLSGGFLQSSIKDRDKSTESCDQEDPIAVIKDNTSKRESKTLHDPMRPVHPEFLEKLTSLRMVSDLISNKYRTDLIRDCINYEDIMDELVKRGCVLGDLSSLELVGTRIA